MVSTFTDNLRLAKQGDNDNPNSWGDVVNNQVTTLVDDAIGGVAAVSVTGTANVDIAATVVNGGADDARNMTLKLTGTLGADIDLVVPDVDKMYILDAAWTDSGGPWTVSVKTSGASTVDLDTGDKAVVYTNGTSITEIVKTPIVVPDAFPSGGIVMWSGLISAIPTGWVLCDGTASTPDLRDQFVVGGRQDDSGSVKTNLTGSLTVSGGSLTTTGDGDHDHGAAVGDTALTVDQMPSHGHDFVSRRNNSYDQTGGNRVEAFDVTGSVTGPTFTMEDTGGDAVHTHSITTSGTHTHTATPPYFALAYIMKT